MLAQSPWSPPVTADVRESLQAVLTSASAYVETRWQIAKLEGGQALRVSAGVVVLGLIIVVSLAVAYIGLVVMGTWWIAEQWGNGDWLMPASLMIGGHLLLAGLCSWRAVRAVQRGRLFHATRKEFMEDKLWLQTNQTFKS